MENEASELYSLMAAETCKSIYTAVFVLDKTTDLKLNVPRGKAFVLE